jgi:hypothetical protein
VKSLDEAYLWLTALAKQPVAVFELPFSQLDASLLQGNPGRVSAVKKVHPEVLPRWHALLKTDRLSELNASEIRQLFWEPDVVLDERFLSVVKSKAIRLSVSSLKGLVYAITSTWKATSLQRAEILKSYQSLARGNYADEVASFLHPIMGPSNLAVVAAKECASISRTIENKLGLALAATQYAEAVLEGLSKDQIQLVIHTDSAVRAWYYREVLSRCQKQVLAPCLEIVASLLQSTDVPRFRDELVEFALKHLNLGDPRLPESEGNWIQSPNAARLLTEWLSSSDINFFFDVFIDDREDSQGRKEFWLRYAHAVKGTRVIMSESDSVRHYSALRDLEGKRINRRMLGLLRQSIEDATAFLMDFGSIKVVEFSKAGRACYIYDNSSGFAYLNRDSFWSEKSFDRNVLKSQLHVSQRLIHSGNWTYKFSHWLRHYGVR